VGIALALVTLLAGGASAARSTSYGACAGAVINDWLQHEPNVVGHYPITCYKQALQQLNSYPDVKDYSNALDDIRRAELAERRYRKQHRAQAHSTPGTSTNRSGGPTAPSGGSNGPSSGGANGATNAPSGGNSNGKGVVTRVIDSVGPGNAQSVPLPLLVLGGLAVLLLLAATGTWIAKRLQARRVAPAPQRR
jgi:hypothetical protein